MPMLDQDDFLYAVAVPVVDSEAAGANLAHPLPLRTSSFISTPSIPSAVDGAIATGEGTTTPAAPINFPNAFASLFRSFSRMRSVSPVAPFLSRSEICNALLLAA